MQIQTVTELVNRLFSAYGVSGLDWEEKINEYSDVVNELIDFDTDLTDLYKKIRLEFAKLPQPSTLKKMMLRTKAKSEVREYQESPDNGKLIVVTCYKKEKEFVIQDKKAGNKIDVFSALEDAEKELAKYEETDKAEGTYKPDFYEVVENEKIIPKQCRSYIVSYDAKPLSETTKKLREIYDDIKVYEFSKDSTLFSRYIKSENRCTGEVWTPIYNAQAEVESYKKIKVA